jgi:hypothetical protein
MMMVMRREMRRMIDGLMWTLQVEHDMKMA